MVASDTEICNQALGAAGTRSQISSLNENSTPARQCLLYYQTTVEEVLQEAQWNFATKFVTLGLITSLPGAPGNNDTGGSQVWVPTYPAPGWLYQYGYPADCLKAMWVIPQGAWGYWLAQAQTDGPWNGLSKIAVPYMVAEADGRTVINTNAQQAILAYVQRVTNVARYPSNFVTAVVGRLAFKLVIPLAGDKVLAQGAKNVADEVIAKVRAQNANESYDVIDNIPDWQKARDWPDWYGGPPGWWLQGGSM